MIYQPLAVDKVAKVAISKSWEFPPQKKPEIHCQNQSLELSTQNSTVFRPCLSTGGMHYHSLEKNCAKMRKTVKNNVQKMHIFEKLRKQCSRYEKKAQKMAKTQKLPKNSQKWHKLQELQEFMELQSGKNYGRQRLWVNFVDWPLSNKPLVSAENGTLNSSAPWFHHFFFRGIINGVLRRENKAGIWAVPENSPKFFSGPSKKNHF